MSRSAVRVGVITDKNVRSVANMWFWGFWVYVECVKVAFQCVHVVFWVFLRWECPLEGVVVLGVTGILPSLLREDSFCMCNVAWVRLTLWLFHDSKNSGNSKMGHRGAANSGQWTVNRDLRHVHLQYSSEMLLDLDQISLLFKFSQLAYINVTINTSFWRNLCKASCLIASLFYVFIFPLQRDE